MAQASLSTGSRSHLLHVLYLDIPFMAQASLSTDLRRSHLSKRRAYLGGFASHIHVLYREVPHILCIKAFDSGSI